MKGINKMSFGSRHKKAQWELDFELENLEFRKLKDLEPDKKYMILGYFFNDGGKFDAHPVVIALDEDTPFLADFPSFATADFKDMNEEDIRDIQAHKAFFKPLPYEHKKYGECMGYEFCD